MSSRVYLVLCEESCCRCQGTGQVDLKSCSDCEGKGFTQYPVPLKKALVDVLLTVTPEPADHD